MSEHHLEDPESLDSDDECIVKTIQIQGGDGKVFNVSLKNASISKFIVAALTEESDETVRLNLPSVDSDILSIVVAYMERKGGRRDISVYQPLRSTFNFEDSCVDEGKWEARFIDEIARTNKEQLHRLVRTSDYLAIDCLLHLVCARIAFDLKGKNTEQIKKILEI